MKLGSVTKFDKRNNLFKSLTNYLSASEFIFLYTAQKIKFFIEHLFSKCDQIHSFMRIWSHLLKKSLMKNLIFCSVKSMNMEIWVLGTSNQFFIRD